MDPFNSFRRQIQSAFDDWDRGFGWGFPNDFDTDLYAPTTRPAITQQGQQPGQTTTGGQLTTRGDQGGALTAANQWNRPPQCRVDVVEQKDGYLVNAELPGVPKEHIKLNIDNNLLTISADRKHEYKEEDKDHRFLRMERSYGNVSRSLRLPKDIDPSKINANYEHGVLKINVPKVPEQQRKQQYIQIQ